MMKNIITLISIYLSVISAHIDISNDHQLVDKLRDSAWYAASVFCTDEQLSKYECNSCRVSGTKFLKSFDDEPTGTRGYLAQNDDKKQIIVSFRGTQNKNNMILDGLPTLVPFDATEDSKGLVHTGFLTSMKSLVPKILEDLKNVVKQNPEYTIMVTGHSLGGAIAALAIEEFRIKLQIPDDKIELHTYGQPKTGDGTFAKWYNEQPITKYRVVSRNDMVPHIKLQDYLGYQHHHNEVWLQGPKENLKMSLCDNVEYEDPNCSESIPQNKLNWEAHTFYFDTVFGSSAC